MRASAQTSGDKPGWVPDSLTTADLAPMHVSCDTDDHGASDSTASGASGALGKTDPNTPRCLATRYVRVNVHFVQDENGGNNFGPVDDPATSLDENGYRWAQGMLWAANWPGGWSQNVRMHLLLGNQTPVWPKRIQLVLSGVYFDRVPNGGAYQYGPANLQGLYNQFGRDKGEVINIFVMDRFTPGSTGGKASDIGPSPDSSYCTIVSPWYGAHLSTPIGAWAYANITNHEIGHLLDLYHTWPGLGVPTYDADACPDTPAHPNCWNSNLLCPFGPYRDALGSNNLMDYNTDQIALTPCQLARIDKRLSSDLAPLLASCGDCSPTYADFGLESDHQPVDVYDGYYNLSAQRALILNGASSVNERAFSIRVSTLDPEGCTLAAQPLCWQPFTGTIDSYQQGSAGAFGEINLSHICHFRPDQLYRVELETTNDCGSSSAVHYFHTYAANVPPCFYELSHAPTTRRAAPAGAELGLRAFPNPSAERVTLTYRLPDAAAVTLELRAPQGNLVRRITPEGIQAAGAHDLTLSVAALPPGLYSVVLTAGSRRAVSQLAVQHP